MTKNLYKMCNPDRLLNKCGKLELVIDTSINVLAILS